jgi:hypothetical protein
LFESRDRMPRDKRPAETAAHGLELTDEASDFDAVRSVTPGP